MGVPTGVENSTIDLVRLSAAGFEQLITCPPSELVGLRVAPASRIGLECTTDEAKDPHRSGCWHGPVAVFRGSPTQMPLLISRAEDLLIADEALCTQQIRKAVLVVFDGDARRVGYAASTRLPSRTKLSRPHAVVSQLAERLARMQLAGPVMIWAGRGAFAALHTTCAGSPPDVWTRTVDTGICYVQRASGSNYHSDAVVVVNDASRAIAFWHLAAGLDPTEQVAYDALRSSDVSLVRAASMAQLLGAT